MAEVKAWHASIRTVSMPLSFEQHIFRMRIKLVSTFSKSSFFLSSLRTSAFLFLRASSSVWKYHTSCTALDTISRSTRSRTTHFSVHNALNMSYHCYHHYKSLYIPSEKLVCVIPKHTDTKSYKQVKVKVKVKFTLEQVTKAQRGSRGMALLLL